MITYPNVKLNLGLRVLRRREDGYHDLDTLFIPCDRFHDTLEIITGDDYSRTSAHLQETYTGAQLAQGITPDGKLMVTLARKEGVDWDPLKDLTARAYGLLAEGRKLPPMKIYLEKTSPVGAGLGGGSADAAFALRMIAELAGLELTDAELAALAARLGSDCAFFVYNRPMLGSGRGEILEPFDIDLSGYRVEVTVPEGIAVSTADAYRGIVPAIPEIPLREALKLPVSQWEGAVVNDFETTVFAKYPRLAEIKRELYGSGAVYAAMSGSGSALFGLYTNKD
jgi:4-diphosphocytidyl-2-C-methyl-D-erythritol kinase